MKRAYVNVRSSFRRIVRCSWFQSKTEKCEIVFIETTISFKLMSYDFYFICRTLISHIKTVKLHDGFDRSVAPLQLQIFGDIIFCRFRERTVHIIIRGIKVHRKLGWWHACDTEKFCWTYCSMICVWRIAWNVKHTKNRNNSLRKCISWWIIPGPQTKFRVFSLIQLYNGLLNELFVTFP